MTNLTGIRPRCQRKISRPAKQRGISLIEMTVVLAVIGLLMLSFWPLMHQLQSQHQRLQQERSLKLAQDHLLFYLRQQGHLPCPSLTPSDAEAREHDGRCQLQLGYLPTQGLGFPSDVSIWYAVPVSTQQSHLLQNPNSSASFWSHQACYDQPQHHCFNISTPTHPLDYQEGYRIQQGQHQISQGQLIWLASPSENFCALADWPARQACLIAQNTITLPEYPQQSWRSLSTRHLLQAAGHLTH